MRKLSLTELEKALRRLKEALALPKDDIVRDSVIQRFEFTVELSWKSLLRALKEQGMQDALTPKNVIREGARLGFVSDPELWIYLIDQRNLSSHTYKEDLAEQVYAAATQAPPLVEKLLSKIKATIEE